MKGQPAAWLQMPTNGLQRFSLEIDGQQMLEGAKGHESKAETLAQIELSHILMNETKTFLDRRRNRGELASRDREHRFGSINAGNVQSRFGEG